jgi:hypothetical protein
LSMKADAQEKTGADYFVGKWNVVVKGTPNGWVFKANEKRRRPCFRQRDEYV